MVTVTVTVLAALLVKVSALEAVVDVFTVVEVDVPPVVLVLAEIVVPVRKTLNRVEVSVALTAEDTAEVRVVELYDWTLPIPVKEATAVDVVTPLIVEYSRIANVEESELTEKIWTVEADVEDTWETPETTPDCAVKAVAVFPRKSAVLPFEMITVEAVAPFTAIVVAAPPVVPFARKAS